MKILFVMDPYEEITYLSQKGYELIESGNFKAAKSYFIDAATIANNSKYLYSNPEQTKLQDVAKTLMHMAREAHDLEFKLLNSKNTEITPVNHIVPINFDPKPSEIPTDSLSFPIGWSYNNKRSIYWNPTDLMNGIMMITGGSGSGKTQTLKYLTTQLDQKGIPCIVLDLHGDIDLEIPVVSLDFEGKSSINPLEITSLSVTDGGPLPHINRLIGQFSDASTEKFSAIQKAWLRNLLQFCYDEKGIKQSDPESWNNEMPTFKDLLRIVRNSEEVILRSEKQLYIRALENVNMSTRMAVENRLIAMLEHPAFSSPNNLKMSDLLSESHRILLKPLNTIDLQFLAADTLMRQIFSRLKSTGHVKEGDSKFRVFIVIDEVKILTGFRGSLNDPYNILNRFATEARKFGLGLILASQTIGHFGRDIRSNCATKLILKTMDAEEAKKCAKELKIDLKELTTIEKPGEGFLITSHSPEASRVQIYPNKSLTASSTKPADENYT